MAKNAVKKFTDPVVITAYRETKTYERKDAIAEFTEGMYACEGAESERYRNIVVALKSGERNIDSDAM